jgi:hypothetical protein
MVYTIWYIPCNIPRYIAWYVPYHFLYGIYHGIYRDIWHGIYGWYTPRYIRYGIYHTQYAIYHYAGHTTVYIIGIYHGILNDIYIYVYTMVYTITSFLHSSPIASLSPAAPLLQRSSRSRFIVWSALASLCLFAQCLPLSLCPMADPSVPS